MRAPSTHHRSFSRGEKVVYGVQDIALCHCGVALEFRTREPSRQILQPWDGFNEETSRHSYFFTDASYSFHHVVVLVIGPFQLYPVSDLQCDRCERTVRDIT